MSDGRRRGIRKIEMSNERQRPSLLEISDSWEHFRTGSFIEKQSVTLVRTNLHSSNPVRGHKNI